MSNQTVFLDKEEARLAFWNTIHEIDELPWWRLLKALELEGRALEIVVNNDLV